MKRGVWFWRKFRPLILSTHVLGLCQCAALAAEPLLDPSLPDETLLADPSVSVQSPEQRSPSTFEPGLSERAIPIFQGASDEFLPGNSAELYRLVRPYFGTLTADSPLAYDPTGPASFRSVITYEPPIGIRPRQYRDGLVEIYPWAGFAQSFETNVELTSRNEKADFYVTPKAGVELQIGSAFSEKTKYLETILALNALYEGYGDIFFIHPSLSAYNQRLEIRGRIGRSSAIFRPYLLASDLTGSNLLIAELVNRARRLRLLTGVSSDIQFTARTGWTQDISEYFFEHTDSQYINLKSFRLREEMSYLLLYATKILAWTEFRETDPDKGYSGDEWTVGLGWAGKPDPRLYTELRIGYGFLGMDGVVRHRKDLSGLRLNGYTTFEWSDRFRPTFRYDREYVFNEKRKNDNYVSTLLQFKGEFFLGGQWYITPYFACALQEFERSRNLTIQWRPEMEISYALPSESRSNDPKLFAKWGYVISYPLRGAADKIEDFRTSFGVQWSF